MSEAQAYIALPYFLRGNAEEQFNSVRGSSSSKEGSVTCWPRAVQYLLRSYATATSIQEAIIDFRDISQRRGETEKEFSTRLNTSFYRCGNVHSVGEKATMSIDGLDPVIKTLVAQRTDESRRMPHLELLQYARAEGDSQRARLSHQRKPAPDIDGNLSRQRRRQSNPQRLTTDRVLLAE